MDEHVRYTLDAAWQSPEFPKGYWPERREPTEAEWKACVADHNAYHLRQIVQTRKLLGAWTPG